MSRNLSAGMITEVTASQLKPAILVKAEFDSGDVLLWSGVGQITYNAEVYTGAGGLLGISEMRETTNIEAQGATFQLTGIDSSLLSIALSEPYQGRPVTCFFACLNSSGAIISTPITLFKGRMDVLQIDESGETSTLTMQSENKLIDLKDSKVKRYTSEAQKQQYPDDLGLDFVASLQDKELTWGVN